MTLLNNISYYSGKNIFTKTNINRYRQKVLNKFVLQMKRSLKQRNCGWVPLAIESSLISKERKKRWTWDLQSVGGHFEA